MDGGKFLAQILESSKNDDLNNFPGMSLDDGRLPKGSKSIKLSWFAITFGSRAGKYPCHRFPLRIFVDIDAQINSDLSRSITGWNASERQK